VQRNDYRAEFVGAGGEDIAPLISKSIFPAIIHRLYLGMLQRMTFLSLPVIFAWWPLRELPMDPLAFDSAGNSILQGTVETGKETVVNVAFELSQPPSQ
jgi:hypothetical protein